MNDEENREMIRVYDEVRPFFSSRKFDEACRVVREHRNRALKEGKREQASCLSEFLATCLTMARRDDEALAAAKEGEEIAPDRVEAKIAVARILLYYSDSAPEARQKLEQAVRQISPRHPGLYPALALLGTARARCGDVDGAIEVFREMTEEETLESLSAANHIGCFDLSLVEELIKQGVVADECRRYLEVVSQTPTEWPHLRNKLDELRARLGMDA